MKRESAYSEADELPEYWFNTRTGLVEVGPQSRARDRIGPFTTRSEAERALETIAARVRQQEQDEAAED